jgi:glutathione S-transferase
MAAEEGIPLDYEMVDLFAGAHLQPAYTAINPSQQVPLLEDGDFRLGESSAILKYLADKQGSPTYPHELRERARVNEVMDWFNTGLYRDLGYGVIYPQTLPHHKREDPAVQAAHLAWGCEKARRWLGILDGHVLGGKRYLCGDQLSIADYFGVAIITTGEVTRFDYAEWPNVARWVAAMKERPSWDSVNEGFYAGFVAPYKEAPFVGL